MTDPDTTTFDFASEYETAPARAVRVAQLLLIDEDAIYERVELLDRCAAVLQGTVTLPRVAEGDLSAVVRLVCETGLVAAHEAGKLDRSAVLRVTSVLNDPDALRRVHSLLVSQEPSPPDPVVVTNAPSLAPAPAIARKPAPAPKGKKVLFIDDERHKLAYYIEAVEEADYEVEFCETAALGLARLRERCAEFDLVILDVQMPTPGGITPVDTNNGLETGFWLLRQARELIETNTLPVIIFSNRSLDVLDTALVEHRNLLPRSELLSRTTKSSTSAMQLPPLITQTINRY